MKTTLAIRLAPWLATAALFIVWEAACRIFNIPVFFLPPPTLVFKAVVEFWPALYKHSLFTLSPTLVGFAMAVGFGLLLGLAVGWSRAIYAGVYPLMIGFNAIPKVAVVPILVLWFGIGFIPAVLTAFLISFFPIVVNVATGLATIEPELLMLDEPFGALDAFTREELWCVIRDLQAARKITIVLVTHDLREAVFLADRIFVMSARPGRILSERVVDIPRPRDLEVAFTPQFTGIVHELREHIVKARQ